MRAGDTASLLRQFQEGQDYSRQTFPEWEHQLAWLPDSFGFAAGLPAVAAATGVRWFCTHKLAWNATNPFPHRLFRWRSRCGAEVLALMTAPIGTDGDPLAMERYRLEWQPATGVADALWLPGVGDHGGGPTAEMLEQLALWQDRRGHGAPAPRHACATTCSGWSRWAPSCRCGAMSSTWSCTVAAPPAGPTRNATTAAWSGCCGRPIWPALCWGRQPILRSRRLAGAAVSAIPRHPAGHLHPGGVRAGRTPVAGGAPPGIPPPRPGAAGLAGARWGQAQEQGCEVELGGEAEPWWWVQLQPLPPAPLTLRLPSGHWSLGGQSLPSQPAPSGGHWVQLPSPGGVAALQLSRQRQPPGALPPLTADAEASIVNPVRLESLGAGERWRLGNGLLWAQLGPLGLEQLWGADHSPQLAEPLQWRRWIDRGEFWDAWDLAADYRQHPLPLHWEPGPVLAEVGPLCSRLVWRGRCGASALRLDLQLRAGCPWLELNLRVDWRQRHELLRLELPLQHQAVRWAADTSAGVIERIAATATAREASRWEVPAISWLASQAASGGLAVLLDGPQGVSGSPEALGVSLLRGPTWPDPGADNGPQRLRLALMPCAQGWRQAGVAAAAVRFREPCWLRPVESSATALGSAQGSAKVAVPGSVLRLGHPDLRLISLASEGEGLARLTVQNLSPCRRWLELAGQWEALERIDGLGAPLTAASGAENASSADGDITRLAPWQLVSWRISRRGRRKDP